MDWDLAIERNREALRRVLAALVAMAGLAGINRGDSLLFSGRGALPPQDAARAEKSKLSPALPRHLHRAVLRLLRPAESAARRLVIVFARNVEVTLAPLRPRKPQPAPTILRNGVGTGIVLPAGPKPSRSVPRNYCLPLTDPLRRSTRRRRAAAGCVPRILFPGFAAPAPVPARPMPGDLVDATRLVLRLAALASALDDLPTHAKRFARWRARAAARAATAAQVRRGRRTWPLRAGKPPGQRGGRTRQPAHEIHALLDDLHGLAFWALEPADTS